jgi:hypothetical protein
VTARAAAVLLLCTTALLAGCGGGGDEEGQALDAQTYAAEVCELALAWSGASELLTGLEAGSVDEADAVQSVVDAQAKTTVFVGSVRDSDAPEGAEAKAAHASLLETADSLSEHSQAIKAEGGKLSSGSQSAAEAAAAVQPQIDLILGDLRDSVTQLDAIATDTDLTAIVRDDQSCRALGL